MRTTIISASIAITAMSVLIAYLVYAADNGSVTAVIVLTALGLMLFMLALIGAIAAILRSIKQSEQEAFLNNAKENMAILSSLQHAQNRLSDGLARQSQSYQKLLSANNNETEFNLSKDDFFGGLEDWQ